jgi:hypothetical protein
LRGGLSDWTTIVVCVEEKFGAYDYRRYIEDLIALRQEGSMEDYTREEGSVEDYTREFEVVQFQVSMFNSDSDDMFFTSHFVNGLKDENRNSVQSQLLD